MNVGSVLESHFGYAARYAGEASSSTPLSAPQVTLTSGDPQPSLRKTASDRALRSTSPHRRSTGAHWENRERKDSPTSSHLRDAQRDGPTACACSRDNDASSLYTVAPMSSNNPISVATPHLEVPHGRRRFTPVDRTVSMITRSPWVASQFGGQASVR